MKGLQPQMLGLAMGRNLAWNCCGEAAGGMELNTKN